jgi:hypothetical protein
VRCITTAPHSCGVQEKHGLRARWTKKGQRSKNGERAITTRSLAHLWLSSALVPSCSSCASRTPLYKGAGSEKRNQRATKKNGKVPKAANPVTTKHPTTAPPIYCHLPCFRKTPNSPPTKKPRARLYCAPPGSGCRELVQQSMQTIFLGSHLKKPSLCNFKTHS